MLADDAEWVLQTPFEGKSVWRGRQEWVEFFRAWTGEFEEYSIQFEPVIDAGDDRVVAIYRQRATGKESGVPVEWHWGMVIELRDGGAIRTTNYPSLPKPSKPPGCRSSCFGRKAAVSAGSPGPLYGTLLVPAGDGEPDSPGRRGSVSGLLSARQVAHARPGTTALHGKR